MASPSSKPKGLYFQNGYHRGSFRSGLIRAFIYGGAITAAIMLLLPFTQMLSNLGKEEKKTRSFDIVQPPPPPPPDIEEPPEEPPPEEPPPEMTQPPPPMSLTQLELALNPGIGDAMAGGLGFGGFDVQPDAAADLELFDIRDLDEPPRAISRPEPQLPFRFSRERVGFSCRIEGYIDEQGNVHVTSVKNLEHNDARAPLIEGIEQWKYEPPMKNGKPVKMRFYFTYEKKFR
jgi:protein TonB